MDKLIHKSFERWTQSEVLMDPQIEQVCKNFWPIRTSRWIHKYQKEKEILVNNNSNVYSRTKLDLFLMVSEDESTMKHHRIRHQLEKSQVAEL